MRPLRSRSSMNLRNSGVNVASTGSATGESAASKSEIFLADETAGSFTARRKPGTSPRAFLMVCT